MKNTTKASFKLIADSYQRYQRSVYLYIYYKIGVKEDSEDLTQDVFLKLMDYQQIFCAETIKYFIFTIARSLLTDYLRRYYKKREILSCMYEHTNRITEDAESLFVARNLLFFEKRRIALLPTQRRKVYVLNRFQEKSVSDISLELNLSKRTVENHLSISRKEVREYMMKCI